MPLTAHKLFLTLGLAISVVIARPAEALAQVGAATSGEAAVSAVETDISAAPRIAESAAKPRAFSVFSASMAALRDSVVMRARTTLGIKYILGGNDPNRGLDCSALIKHVLSSFGITLPRTAQEQSKMGVAVPKDRNLMRPGDLLTFGSGSRITHIGMYVGDGKFIHASTSRKEVIESTLDQTRSSLVRQWKGVRRLVDSGLVASRYESVFAFLDDIGESTPNVLLDTLPESPKKN